MTPKSFSQVCLAVAAAWMVVVWPAMVVFCPDRLPYEMKPSQEHADFEQYYAGAVVARDGIWDALYPVPRSSVYDRPSSFKPLFRTFLYRPPAPTSRDPDYYPDIKQGVGPSAVSPKLVAAFPLSESSLRYIYPPPLALLLWPLAFFSYQDAGVYLWPVLSIWSLFLGLYFAARTARLLFHGWSYFEGWLILAWLVFTFRGRMHLYDGNISPVLTGLICLSVFAFARARPLGFALAFVPLALFKSLGIAWLGLLVLDRSYWRYLALIVVLVLLVNGITVGVEGPQVYRTFFALLPKIAIPGGVGIQGTLLQWFGFHCRPLFTLLHAACIGLLYYGFWKSAMRGMERRSSVDYPLYVVALLAGTMASFCLFNFNIWLPYCPSYLFYPFLGWMMREAKLAQGLGRYLLVGGIWISLLALSSEWALKALLLHFSGPAAERFYDHFIFPPFCILLIPLFFLVVALARMWQGMRLEGATERGRIS